MASSNVLFDYWALTKPEINFLIAMTAAAGYWWAHARRSRTFRGCRSFIPIFGTVLVASGAATLNQLIELRYDAQMRRTRGGRLFREELLLRTLCGFGVLLSILVSCTLPFRRTPLRLLLAALTLLSYLFLYTPLKRITPLCTLVGAIPGAAPPLIGWAAARGRLDPTAWVLFAIVFLWQLPHFMSIA